MPALLTCKHGARDRGRMDQGGGWSRSGATIIRTGVLIVIVVQIGMISPPVGMNMFVVKNLLKHISMADVFRGVTPFAVALVTMLLVIVAFPGLATWLPSFMR